MGGVSQPGTLSGRRITAVLTALFSSAIPAHADGLDQVRDFNIEEQALDSALIEFSEQAGVQLMVPTELVVGLRSPSIAGQYATDNALVALLDGSELTFQTIGNDTVALQATDERGASDSKNLIPTPMLMAQSQTRSTSTTAIRSEEGGTSVVTGRVTDARTGANLKGAKVTIEETGQWTSTGDLGRFRFASVPQGEFTLIVSFLGYAGQSIVIGVRGDSVSQDFALRGGDEIEEIVVFGTRSARAIALNQQWTAQNNSTVISSDHLGQFSSTNLPDALRRVPGVSFIQNVRTGEAQDIAIRGLTRDLNSVQLNGITVPGNGGTRFADISTVLTDSIESVTVSKSLLPSQETNGTGGLVEIVTKSPLDRPDYFYQFGYENAQGTDDIVNTNYFTAIASRKFLESKNLGLSVSAQYSDDEISGSSYGGSAILNPYFPEGISNESQIDPRLPFPFLGGTDAMLVNGYSASNLESERENLNVNVAAAYHPSDDTTIRLDYSLVDSDAISTSSEVTFFSGLQYRDRPVAALDGAIRTAADWTGFFNQTRQLNISPIESKTHALTLQTDTHFGAWELRGLAGFSQRESNGNGSFTATFGHDNRFPDATLFTPEIVDSIEGIVLSPNDQISGIPLFSEAGLAEYADSERLALSSAVFNFNDGKDTRLHLEGDVRIQEPWPFVNYIAIGVDIEDARFESNNDAKDVLGASTLAAANLPTSYDAFSGPNSFRPFPISPAGAAAGYRDFVEDNAGSGGVFTISDFLRNPLERETYTDELTIDYFLEASIKWRTFELIAGVRVATTELEAGTPTTVRAFGPGFVPLTELNERLTRITIGEADQTSYLPRVLLNYRPNDKTVVRAAYYRTASRPALGGLGALADYILVLDPVFGDGTQNLALFELSNPNLLPTETDNFDLGIEHYFQNGGIVKASLFFKSIENLGETVTTENSSDVDSLTNLPDDPVFDDILENPQNYVIELSRPQNNNSTATVWGGELEYEQQLTMLPGAWGGLGVFGNVAYTESEKDATLVFLGEEVIQTDVPFNSQPRYSGTLGITYNYANIDANIGYSFQGRTFNGNRNFGLDQYTSSFDTLDFRVEYRQDTNFGNWRVFVEGSDMLRDSGEPNINSELGGADGVPTIRFPGGGFFGGRTIRLGALLTFN